MRGSKCTSVLSAEPDREDLGLALRWAASRLRLAKASGEQTVKVTPRVLSLLLRAACAAGAMRSDERAAA